MTPEEFHAVRITYACYAQKGLAAYRKERRYVLNLIRIKRKVHGARRSRYYQHALAGLRQLGI